MSRRYGPEIAPGVVVEERDGRRQATPSQFGVTLSVGPTERGMGGGKLLSMRGPKEVQRQIGEEMATSHVTTAIKDYFESSGGTGEVIHVRLDDGTGRKAAYTFLGRDDARTPQLVVRARGVGDAYGRRIVLGGVWNNTGADLTETTLKVKITAEPFLTRGLLVDELKGAALYLDAVDTKYTIVSNTASTDEDAPAVLTVKSDSTMSADYALTGSSDKGFIVVLESDLSKDVSVKFGDGQRNPALEFSMYVFNGQTLVRAYSDLSMDPESDVYVVNRVNNDAGNIWVEVEDLLNVGGNPTYTAANRPANETGRYTELEKTSLTKKLFYTTLDTTSADPIVTFGATTDSMRWPTRLTLTMSSNTAGTLVSDRFGTVGTLALGDANKGTSDTIVPTCPAVPSITVENGASPFVSGDKVIVDYAPWVPDALAGSDLIADGDQAPLVRWRIYDNDHKSITIQSGSLFTAGKLGAGSFFGSGSVLFGFPGATALLADEVVIFPTEEEAYVVDEPFVTTDITSVTHAAVTNGPFQPGEAVSQATSGATGVVILDNGNPSHLLIRPDAGSAAFDAVSHVVTGATSGATTASTAVYAVTAKVIMHGAVTGTFTPGEKISQATSLAQGVFLKQLTSTTMLVLQTASAAFTTTTLITGASSGATTSAHTSTGPAAATVVPYQLTRTLVAGAKETVRVVKHFRVESGTALEEGYYGLSGIADSHYLEMLDPGTSPFRKLRGQNKGLVKLMLPGKTSVDVQQAAATFCEAMGGWVFVPEFPDSITTEDAAVDWGNNTLGRSDFVALSWPTYWECKDRKSGLLKTRPITGQLLGLEAAFATQWRGYHRPAAGDEAQLTRCVRPSFVVAGQEFEINMETLQRGAVNGVRPAGPSSSVMIKDGNLMFCADTQWRWKSVREQASHYLSWFIEHYTWVVHALNDPSELLKLRRFIEDEFRGEVGENRPLKGSSLRDGMELKIDSDNNPPEEEEAGRAHVEVGFRFKKTINQLVFGVGQAGITERAS